LHHLDEVTLGGTTLVAHLTPAHTPGCTTWTMKIQDSGQSYNVVILGCGLGTGPLVDDAGNVTKEATDYIKSFRYLRSLPCDVFLAAHGTQYNLMAKYSNAGKSPQGYQTELDNWEKFFTAQLAEQVKMAIRKTR
jgi:metallo-beta-lactamase class B